jgi:hypothetical protein
MAETWLYDAVNQCGTYVKTVTALGNRVFLCPRSGVKVPSYPFACVVSATGGTESQETGKMRHRPMLVVQVYGCEIGNAETMASTLYDTLADVLKALQAKAASSNTYYNLKPDSASWRLGEAASGEGGGAEWFAEISLPLTVIQIWA